MAEELMKSLALTVATTAILTFAFPLTPQVLAQGTDDGAVGRPLQLDGGPSVGSENHGQAGSKSEATEPSASSKKSQTAIEKAGETAIGGRSKTHIGSRLRPRHRFAVHKRRYHVFAFHVPRQRFAFHGPRQRFAFHVPGHRFVIHRHGRRFVAVNESAGA
jgi:hypothetical protein